MKRENVHRASTLVSALASMKKLAEACAPLVAPPNQPDFSDREYFQLAVGMPFKTNNLGARSDKVLVLLDLATGKLIAEAAEKVIREQLIAVGVEL